MGNSMGIPINCHEAWKGMMAAGDNNFCAVIALNNQSSFFNIYPQLSSAHTELLIECHKPVEEGYYTFSIWNEKGRPIQQQNLWIDKDAKSMNLEVPGMIKGDYYLEILNANNGNAFREKITIGK